MIGYRQPVLEDIDALAQLHVRCWQDTYAGIMDEGFLRTLSVEKRADGWRNTLADHESFAILAHENGELVGFATSGPARLPMHGDGEVYAIYLAAKWQRKGIGTALFQVSKQNWFSRGGSALHVCVVAENVNAVAFYQSQGGQVVAEQKFEMAGMKLRELILQFAR